RRIPLPLRRGARAVRPRERDRRRHAPGPARPLLLRHRIRAARSPPRARRGLGRPDRHAGRLDPPLLLPLRPGERQVRSRRRQHGPSRRPRHGRPDRRGDRGDEPPPRPRAPTDPRSVRPGLGEQPLMPFVPPQASSFAPHVDALYGFMIAVTAFFSILIGTLVVVFAIKYHRKSPDEVATEIHESAVLEIAWTIIPVGIVLVMFYWGAQVYFRITRPPADAIEIYVTGKQWMWKIQHADGHREMNELHVPVDRPIRLTMASEDVIHSFFVPAFRFKRDVVPGRFSTAWFEATEPGKYHLFCAEFCGTRHSGMIGWVYVMTP